MLVSFVSTTGSIGEDSPKSDNMHDNMHVTQPLKDISVLWGTTEYKYKRRAISNTNYNIHLPQTLTQSRDNNISHD